MSGSSKQKDNNKQKDNKASKVVLRSETTFNEEDRQNLKEINRNMKELLQEIHELKEELAESKAEIKRMKIENSQLKQAANINIRKVDEMEQYGRRENIRIHGVPEIIGNRDDGEKVALEIAEKLNIKLKTDDIQRAHRLGWRKRTMQKPRPIIVRFISYKKRNEFMFAKSRLKEIENYTNCFITEDLTPLRSKLLHYVKNECENKFVMVHTMNGKIRCKKSAKSQGQQAMQGEKDEGFGGWITITSPEDLAKFDIEVNFNKFNYQPLMFNYDPDVSRSSCSSFNTDYK